jgi:hypothetical protein
MFEILMAIGFLVLAEILFSRLFLQSAAMQPSTF